MIITKGQHLHIKHSRKGEFDAVATRDFDTETETVYPVAVAKGNYVKGVSVGAIWEAGEEIPCRKSLTTLRLV